MWMIHSPGKLWLQRSSMRNVGVFILFLQKLPSLKEWAGFLCIFGVICISSDMPGTRQYNMYLASWTLSSDMSSISQGWHPAVIPSGLAWPASTPSRTREVDLAPVAYYSHYYGLFQRVLVKVWPFPLRADCILLLVVLSQASRNRNFPMAHKNVLLIQGGPAILSLSVFSV